MPACQPESQAPHHQRFQQGRAGRSHPRRRRAGGAHERRAARRPDGRARGDGHPALPRHPGAGGRRDRLTRPKHPGFRFYDAFGRPCEKTRSVTRLPNREGGESGPGGGRKGLPGGRERRVLLNAPGSSRLASPWESTGCGVPWRGGGPGGGKVCAGGNGDADTTDFKAIRIAFCSATI